jgi:hypothetical protein
MNRVANNVEYVGKRMIRAKEVAVNYGIGLSTVWHYKKLGLITSHKVSEKVTLFSVKELDEFFGYTA